MKGWQKFCIFLCLIGLLLGVPGCSAATGGSKGGTLDIDYVGADGEITEEEVTADSESLMDWLKNKLSSDKKNAEKVTGREEAAADIPEGSGIREALYGQTETEREEERDDGQQERQETERPDNESDADIPVQDNPDESVDIPLPNQSKPEKPNAVKPGSVKKNTVTFTIRCDTAVANGMHKESQWAGIVPASGCILPVITMEFEDGETVFDLLCRVRDTYKLQMEYSGTNGGQYIEGINNLYEFDGGRWSGWMYCVNGWYPNYGCGQYTVQSGDVIEWNYTCDLGLDLDGGWWEGAQEWKDTHD